MTPLDKYLSEVKERCEAATAGPWSTLGEPGEVHSVCLSDGAGGPLHIAIELAEGTDDQFIAHSREDVPKLLALLKIVTKNMEDHGCFCHPGYDDDEIPSYLCIGHQIEREWHEKLNEIAGEDR